MSKKAVLIVAILALSVVKSLAQDSSGTCGTNLTWTFNSSTGVLTISGTGKMTDYQNSLSQPWNSLSIKTVMINNGVTSIGENAFSNCFGLTSITIPNSVTSIGVVAFAGCFGLTSITIPESVTSIGSQVFYWCSSLASIDVASGNLVYSSENGVLFNKTKTELVCFPGGKSGSYTIPASVTSIGTGAFECCIKLTFITIPEGVTSIGGRAFNVCSGLTSITIPTSVTNIGYMAFSSCTGLTSVTVNWMTPLSINSNTFSETTFANIRLIVPPGTKSLYQTATVWKEFRIEESTIASGTCGQNLTWTFNRPTGALTINGTGSMTNYLDGNQPWASFASSIQTVVINNGATSIGDHAFMYCTGLASVTIPTSVTGIGESAFYNCIELASVSIPNSVTSIGESAFLYCTRLTSVTIPNSVKSIGDYAFMYCTGLASVMIPKSVTSIGAGAFSRCTGLTSITLPEGLTSIGLGAFRYCSGLTSITIPSSVKSIGYHTFAWCEGLASVTVNWTTPLNIDPSVFLMETALSNIRLIVPLGTKSLYQATAVWKDFRIEESGTGIDDIQTATFVRLEQSGDELYISYPSEIIDGVEIFDMNGRSVYRKSGGFAAQSISVASWAKGVYLVVVRTGNNKTTHKFLKK